MTVTDVSTTRQHFHLTLMMTSAQVVETSVTVTDNSPFQDYPHPDDHTTQSTVTPGFKPFTELVLLKIVHRLMNPPAGKNEAYQPTVIEQIANIITHGVST